MNLKMHNRLRWLAAAAVLGAPLPAAAQVIVKSPYRPPETVQRVSIPINPTEKRIRVLIISGQNSYEHDWTGVDNLLRTQLQDTHRFDVRVTEDFDHGTLAMLKSFDVVLLNYSSRWNYSDAVEHRWSAEADKALLDYVREGGGLVAYHSAFTWGQNWPDYQRMIGAVMDPGQSRRSPPGGFPVHVIDHDHPITVGMRDYFFTFNDDMYSNMKFDPAAKIHVLATTHDVSASYAPALAGPKYPAYAYTPEKLKAMKGLDVEQPAVWVADYGKGRVFSFTLGHGPDTLMYGGVRNFLARGTEWAATGKVTVPVEPDLEAFPLETTPPSGK